VIVTPLVDRLIGAIGEELVVAALRTDLIALGYPELARAVRHVSLESDQLGYDITAPRVGDTTRLLEVKTTNAAEAEMITFHLSRNEAETGLRYSEWALVVCTITNVAAREGQIVGWKRATALAPAFPVDSPGGRWESVAVTIDVADLLPGLPPAT
jgi:hypothetical protein